MVVPIIFHPPILPVLPALHRTCPPYRLQTTCVDVGIDGQIEHVNASGQATGQLVAVQVKSGGSYLNDRGSCWHFYPYDKHRFYWERFPIPVLIAVHDPGTGTTYWAEARRALRSPETAALPYIIIPKEQQLQSASVPQLFASYGPSQEPILAADELVHRMIAASNPSPGFPITFFELFAHGLTNICRSVYFGMDMACSVVEQKLLLASSEIEMQLREEDHAFLFSYVQFLVAQHLANVDLEDCLIDWWDAKLQPQFLSPLTSRGRALVSHVNSIQDKLDHQGALPEARGLHVAQEDFVRMIFDPTHDGRVPLILSFQKAFQPRCQTT
jgi:hypothetical protein